MQAGKEIYPALASYRIRCLAGGAKRVAIKRLANTLPHLSIMKTIELKKCTLKIHDFTIDEIRELTDAQLMALVESGVSNWTYRAGARKENDGKKFFIYDIADDLATVRSRTGEPSEADIKASKAWYDTMLAGHDAADLQYVEKRINSKLEINNEKFGTDCSIDFYGDIPAQLAQCWREWRLAIARQSKDI